MASRISRDLPAAAAPSRQQRSPRFLPLRHSELPFTRKLEILGIHRARRTSPVRTLRTLRTLRPQPCSRPAHGSGTAKSPLRMHPPLPRLRRRAPRLIRHPPALEQIAAKVSPGPRRPRFPRWTLLPLHRKSCSKFSPLCSTRSPRPTTSFNRTEAKTMRREAGEPLAVATVRHQLHPQSLATLRVITRPRPAHTCLSATHGVPR